MKLGTAKIARQNGLIVLTYVNTGSFLVGERTYTDAAWAMAEVVEFCRSRGLKVVG